MKRYMQLILEILKYTERYGNGKELSLPEVEGYTPDQVNYHVKLCEEAGYLDDIFVISPGRYEIGRLTWQGHEFLDKSQNH